MQLLKYGSLILPFIGYTSLIAGVGVATAIRIDPAAAGLVASLGALGALLGSVSSGFILNAFKFKHLSLVLNSFYLLLSSLTIYLCYFALSSVLIATGVMATTFVWSILRIMDRVTSASWGETWIRKLGPLGRVGAALGGLLGGFAGLSTSGWALLLFLNFFTLSAPCITHYVKFTNTTVHVWRNTIFFYNFFLSLSGYGPLVLIVAFTSLVAGPLYVGVAIAAYALGSVLAPFVAFRVRDILHTSPKSWLVLGILANISWFLVIINPIIGVIISRVLSGLFIFLAEGSADFQALKNHAMPAAAAGRAIGGFCAGIIGTMLIGLGFTVIGIVSIYIMFGVVFLLVLHFKPMYSDKTI